MDSTPSSNGFGVENAESKKMLIYYTILGVAAVLILGWYFYFYPKYSPIKYDLKRVENDLRNFSNNPANKLSEVQLKDAETALKNTSQNSTSKLSEDQLKAAEEGLRKVSNPSQ